MIFAKNMVRNNVPFYLINPILIHQHSWLIQHFFGISCFAEKYPECDLGWWHFETSCKTEGLMYYVSTPTDHVPLRQKWQDLPSCWIQGHVPMVWVMYARSWWVRLILPSIEFVDQKYPDLNPHHWQWSSRPPCQKGAKLRHKQYLTMYVTPFVPHFTSCKFHWTHVNETFPASIVTPGDASY